MSADDTRTPVTLSQTVSAPNKVIVNVVNQDSSRNKVTPSENGMVVSNVNLVPARVPGKSSASTAPVQVLPKDTVSVLLQSYISSQLLQAASRNQPSSVSRTVVSVPGTAETHASRSSSNSPGTMFAGSVSRSPPIQFLNFNVKIFNPVKKKEFETYVLREVRKDSITTPALLRKELTRQFGVNVSTEPDFTIGYIKSGCKLAICSTADMEEVWKSRTKGDNVTLWCYGPRYKNGSDESDSDEGTRSSSKKKRRKTTALEEKSKRVESTVSSLKEKHGSKFTTIQYRLWGEMIDVGTHKSLDEPPGIPAFSGRQKQPNSVQVLTTAMSEMAKNIASINAVPNKSDVVSSDVTASISPVKVANLRASYLKQLRDLHQLLDCGAITQGEFADQKKPILEQLTKLKPM